MAGRSLRSRGRRARGRARAQGGGGVIRLAAYTDASILGGAEQALGGLVQELGPHVDVTLLGAHRTVTSTLAARRPGTRFAIVPPIRHKTDVRTMLRFARVVAAARPDILQINLPTPWTCKHETLIGALLPGVRTVLVEHLPVEPDGAVDPVRQAHAGARRRRARGGREAGGTRGRAPDRVGAGRDPRHRVGRARVHGGAHQRSPHTAADRHDGAARPPEGPRRPAARPARRARRRCRDRR